MSAAGGVTRAVERAVLHGCEALQIFSKNNARWLGKPLDPDDVRTFRSGVEANRLAPVVAHASYLINLAAPAGPLRHRTIRGPVGGSTTCGKRKPRMSSTVRRLAG